MFKSLGLQSKILAIITLISTLVIAGLALLEWSKFDQTYRDTATTLAKTLQTDMQRSLQTKQAVGITNAVAFAANQQLVAAIAGQDRQTALQALATVNQTYAANTGFKNIKIHIHTPQNRSFLRVWNPEKHGDDLSAFRFGIQQVIEKRQAIGVLELGREGLSIRGITPLFDNGRYIGSLEFIQGMASVARDYDQRNMHYAMLLNDYALTISTRAKNNPRFDSYVLSNQDAYTPQTLAMLEQLDWATLKQQGWLVQSDRLITLMEVEDLQGKVVGVQILGAPTDELNAAMNAQQSALFKEIGLLILVVLLMAAGIVLATRQLVLLPVKRLQSTIETVTRRGDFSARAPLSANQDEITRMGHDFNHLIDTTQQVLGEISATMHAIGNGELTRRVTIDTVGDLATLKNSINQSADTLDATMKALAEVLDALGRADFGAQIDSRIQAKGAFKAAMDNAQATQSALHQALSEINAVAAHMADSDFSQPITLELSGDLNTLKRNINQALGNLKTGFDSFNGSLTNLIDGDLTAHVVGDYKGELARLQHTINTALNNIATIFIDIKTTSASALNNIEQLSAGNQNLNERTQSQAASIEETAASMEEITSTVQNSLGSAKEANQLAQQARHDAN